MMAIARYFDRDETGDTYQLVERTLEPVMFALGVLFVPILLGPLLSDLSPEARTGMRIVGWGIWAAFGVEFLWLLYVSPNRSTMIRTHKLDLMIVILPFFRPLRFLRIVRVGAAGSAAGRAVVALRRIGARPGMQPFFAMAAVAIAIGAALVLAFEHSQPGSSISNYGDALWWAFVTSTTVGYGDYSPVTAGGRMVAISLMLVGIAGLSLVTASVAAMFVNQDEGSDVADMRAQLERIEGLLNEQRQS